MKNVIERFEQFNEDGIIIPYTLPMTLENRRNPYVNVNANTALSYINSSSKKGVRWRYQGMDVCLFDPNGSIYASLTVDLKYIVASYHGQNVKYPAPNNCVVYNLDGTVHRILKVPRLVSKLIADRIAFLNEENPPLSFSNLDGGLYMGVLGWVYLNNSNINVVNINFDRDLYETRIVDPETGEFGDCIHSGCI